MKRTIISVLAATALIFGITAPAANATLANTWVFEDETYIDWTKSVYMPNDKTATIVIRNPKITKAIVGTTDDNGDFVALSGTTTKKAKNEDGVPGYNITFKNPKEALWMNALVYIKGKSKPHLIDFSFPYMNSLIWVNVSTLGGAPGETKKIVARVTGTYPKMNYTIQIKTKGKWKTVKTFKNIKTPTLAEGVNQILPIKLPKKAGKYTYRITASNPYNDFKNTSSFKMRVVNQKPHTPYLNRAKKYVKRYCPSTSVYINKGGYKFTGFAGMAYSSDLAFALRPGMDNKVLKSVSVHECAHVLQYHVDRFAPKQIADKRTDAGPKVYKHKYGIPWTEIEADCMALLMQGIKSSPIQYYTKTCTPKQFKMAKNTLKNGIKYYKKVN